MTTFQPVKLAYKIFEPSAGVDEDLCPVIFLHGLTASKENWDEIPQVIANKTKRKAYAVDARNHGDSEFSDVFNFEINVDDLFHFMDTMNIERAALVGHSMGGMTSIRAALSKPEKVEKFISEDMYVKKCSKENVDYVLGFVNLWIEGVRTAPPGLPEREAIRHAAYFVHSKLPPEQQKMIPKEQMALANVRLRSKPDGTYDVSYNKEAVITALQDYHAVMSEPKGQYSGPAFFIYGSLSPFQVGNDEENIKKHFPKAELIEFEGANHSIHAEFKEKFIDTILEHL